MLKAYHSDSSIRQRQSSHYCVIPINIGQITSLLLNVQSAFDSSSNFFVPAKDGLALRQEGGSEGTAGLIAVSSGLEIPTKRNTFPITRTKGRIFNLEHSQATLFLTNDPPSWINPPL
jgi:hypothetical protein